ncbi:hypothetical protein CTAYLR_009360 [Chrysophaeum taylorii]|uniref:PH domain-containing protein n=1 Tax=Chrysophaeum taylorii TaxID=2483200 RepID=A0AAD7UKG2_9STRA|nr:hypothetical protein CTAYLR_009360 [Chrysophaeum taylorii]
MGYEHVGRLYKKRGGMGRHARTPWVSRQFALNSEGLLMYFDADNVDKTPRGSLHLPRSEAVLSTVEDASDDAPTRHMLIITHIQGQRWKLCAETTQDLAVWRDKLSKWCRQGRGYQEEDGRKVDGSREVATANGVAAAAPKVLAKPQSAAAMLLRPAKNPPARPGGARQLNRQASRRNSQSKVGKELATRAPSGEVAKALVVVNLSALVAWTAATWAASIAVVLLVNAYVAALVVRGFDQAPPASETLVSLIVPPARLPTLDAPPRRSTGDALGRRSKSPHAAAGKAAARAPGGKVVAGATGLREVAFDEQGGPPGTWSVAPGSTFKIRQVGYAKSKRKAPSEDAFFQVVSVDLFDTDARVNRMSDHVSFALPTVKSPDPDVPSLFVVNAQIPSETGPLRVKLDADGHGYQVLICMQLTERTRRELELLAAGGDVEIPERRANALKLLKTYCRVAPDEPQLSPKDRGRFKVLAQIRNIDEVSIPNFAKGYNGKPALIAKTGMLTRSADRSLLEMDVNVHAFGYLARSGLQSIYREFQTFILSIGFVIEGRDDSELPEVCLTALDLNHLNWTMAVPL